MQPSCAIAHGSQGNAQNHWSGTDSLSAQFFA